MSDFPDVEKFAQQHVGCGGLTPSAVPRAGGGYVLTLTCACGAIHKRVVTLEEARKPLPIPRAATRLAKATAPPSPPAAPSPAPVEPPRAAASADVVEALEAALAAASAAPPASPPPAAERRATPPAGGDLEAVIRAALAAEEAAAAAPPPAAAPAATGAPPAGRPSPARLDLDATIRKALDRQRQQAASFEEAAPPPSRVKQALLVLVVFAVVAGASFVLLGGLSDESEETTVAGAPGAPRLGGEPRAALEAVVATLRQVQASTPPDASYPVYASRVLVAKADVERYVQSEASAPGRALAREMMDLHLLASAALQARSLERKDTWEALGRDPALDLCPDVTGGLDAAAPAAGLSAEQARGAAVAAAAPQLFECARRRLADLERLLGPR